MARLASPRVELTDKPDHLNQPVLAVARKDAAVLHADFTVQQALEAVRQRGVGEKIVYFFVVDAPGRLDPKIAAGPVTLAFTDIFTLL